MKAISFNVILIISITKKNDIFNTYKDIIITIIFININNGSESKKTN